MSVSRASRNYHRSYPRAKSPGQRSVRHQGCRGELVRVCLMASPTAAQSPALPAEGDEGSLKLAAQQESGKMHGRLRLQATSPVARRGAGYAVCHRRIIDPVYAYEPELPGSVSIRPVYGSGARMVAVTDPHGSISGQRTLASAGVRRRRSTRAGAADRGHLQISLTCRRSLSSLPISTTRMGPDGYRTTRSGPGGPTSPTQ
jgi:hypothetical protein